MGQQQILLILLVTIVVGIATVVAITTFENTRMNSNHESIKVKMIESQGLAAMYHSKIKALGGGGNSFQNISLEHLNISEDNQLGQFSISEEGTDSFTLTAIPASGGDNIVGVIYRDRIEFVNAEDEE
ncbi:MAG: hypothetical protein CL666_07800 [Balneola sp.]|nr:hypothetical protein [Balneola sp.]|tara:strand:+ start:29381 stop:29764 length:384 start_codon:yes stop_codon:yes gene_type:complete